jgi:hypothetical protein
MFRAGQLMTGQPDKAPVLLRSGAEGRGPRAREVLRRNLTQQTNAGRSGASGAITLGSDPIALHDPARLSNGFLVKVNQHN